MKFFTTGKIILIIIGIVLLIAVAYRYFHHTYIKAKFDRLDPLPTKMGVYYKGYKLGKTNKVRISKDFSTTYLDIQLNQRGLHLPKNIVAEIKIFDNNKYVDILYPEKPNKRYIKNGDIIKGKLGFSSNKLYEVNQNNLSNLAERGENFLESATETTETLTDLINLSTEIINENRKNITNTTTNLKISMENLNEASQQINKLTEKLNKGISNTTIANSSANIEETTANITKASKNLISISENLNKTSKDLLNVSPQIHNILNTLEGILCHLNNIVKGVNRTLKKSFGGARLIFGKTIQQ